MSVGMALLVHHELDRAAQLVVHLQSAGCKVAIHVDEKVKESEYSAFYQKVAPLEGVDFTPRIHCEWGRFSLVEAQLATAELLVKSHADISHVIQLSGSCLPNRPLPELLDFLKSRNDTDFIESVLVGGVNWIKGGLEAERFSLYFPFSFIKHRRLFDAHVWFQRKLGIKRKLPEGLTPHIGSQWWALTKRTLVAILNDPDREKYATFFKHCWIPDESYFQTLVRKHGKRIKSRSLTYSRFDFHGKPMLFYDDHARFVEHLDSFFIRKTWQGANELYDKLLGETRQAKPRDPVIAAAFHASFEKAESRWLKGRDGLFMQGRAPRLTDLNTATTYTVLTGFDRVFNNLAPWMQKHTGVVLHENLWSKNKKQFEEATRKLKGNIGSSRRIRDYNAEGFLLNFIWNHSDDEPIFNFDPEVSPSLAKFISLDPNARVFHIRSAWLLDLLREKSNDKADLIARVQAHMLKEQAHLEALEAGKANVQIFSLAEVFNQPGAVLEDLILALRARRSSENREIPAFLPYDGIEDYFERLKDAGLNLHTDFETSLLFTGQNT